VSQRAQAVADEARFTANDNVAIVALEEAEGTLLDDDEIAVVAAPVGSGRLGLAASAPPTEPSPKADVPPKRDDAGRTVSFQFQIHIGATPVDLRGSFIIGPPKPDEPSKQP
jgi:hypothetical protein